MVFGGHQFSSQWYFKSFVVMLLRFYTNNHFSKIHKNDNQQTNKQTNKQTKFYLLAEVDVNAVIMAGVAADTEEIHPRYFS